MNYRSFAAALAATVVMPFAAAQATDLEVTHWWTSGGEAAAVAELAKAFDATGNKWVDGAIAGSGGTARPIMTLWGPRSSTMADRPRNWPRPA